MVRSPVDICLGTRPIQAEKSHPLANATPLPIAATIALEMIGPMPGTVVALRQLSTSDPSSSLSACFCFRNSEKPSAAAIDH
jgi:hypothetical protein